MYSVARCVVWRVAAPTANVPQQIHLEKGVTVYVVFGVKDIDRSGLTPGHVLSEKVCQSTCR